MASVMPVLWDTAPSWRLGRVICRVLHRHNTTCVGRRDHLPDHAPGSKGCGRWTWSHYR